MTRIRYFLEAILVYIFYGFCKIMPVDTASNFGGFLGEHIGIRLAASRKAYKNLQRVFPENTQEQNDSIVREVWNNLGRVMAEYPHLSYIVKHRVKITNPERLTDMGQAIYVAGHLGNWEVAAPSAFAQCHKRLNLTYRAPNNIFVDKLLLKARSLNGQLTAYPKESKSGRALMQCLRNGESLAILIDQKYNEGLNVPFFDHSAMTNPVFASFALKYDVPLIPAQVKRTKGAHFEMVMHEPISLTNDKGEKRNVEELIKDTHILLEDWIKEKPGQWIWLHRRWKED